MKITSSSNTRVRRHLTDRKKAVDPNIDRHVAKIIDDVRRRGDRALIDYARRFDGLTEPVEVSAREIRRGAAETPSAVQTALRKSAIYIRRIAKLQVPRQWRSQAVPGVVVEQRVTPLARVGCYVPGGRYPLPSSLLMTAIPARVAGVSEVIAVCPRLEPAVCSAALEAGITRLFRIGGAHAIAALAYGTKSVPRVDKIAGPGSTFVASAKAKVSTDCPIDFFAGPTEIVIVASKGNPDWLAADLVAQAEHDPDARAVLLTPSTVSYTHLTLPTILLV